MLRCECLPGGAQGGSHGSAGAGMQGRDGAESCWEHPWVLRGGGGAEGKPRRGQQRLQPQEQGAQAPSSDQALGSQWGQGAAEPPTEHPARPPWTKGGVWGLPGWVPLRGLSVGLSGASLASLTLWGLSLWGLSVYGSLCLPPAPKAQPKAGAASTASPGASHPASSPGTWGTNPPQHPWGTPAPLNSLF